MAGVARYLVGRNGFRDDGPLLGPVCCRQQDLDPGRGIRIRCLAGTKLLELLGDMSNFVPVLFFGSGETRSLGRSQRCVLLHHFDVVLHQLDQRFVLVAVRYSMGLLPVTCI